MLSLWTDAGSAVGRVVISKSSIAIDGVSGFDGSNGQWLKPPTLNNHSLSCNDIATYLTAGEGQGSAVEGEGAPSDKQTEDPTGQSRRDGGVEVGLEIDGGAVDATVAVDRGEDGGVALVGGQGRVLDKEELGADLQGIVGGLAAVHPDGGTVGDLLRSGQAVIGDREANPFDHIPQGCIVGGVQNHLVAGDGGARGAGHGVDGLAAMEEGQLVALEKGGVVVDDSLGELRHGSCRSDGEGAEADATYKDVGGVLGHADARQGATRNLIGCEDGATVKSHCFGDVHLDDTKVGLDEGIVDAHVRGQFLEATAQHAVELLVDGTEIRPLGADVHLLLAAARRDGFDRGFADDGTHFGLAVDVLAYLAPNLCVYSENFCHNVFPFCF